MRTRSIRWVALVSLVPGVVAAGAGLPGAAHAAADDPPVVAAARAGDTVAVRDLLAAGDDPLIPSADGTTPLMVAAGIAIFIPGEDGGSLPGQEDEVLEAVRMCVELGTDVNATNFRNETALHGAAFRGVNRIVESDFFKAQTHTADLLRKPMASRGLPAEGHVVDPLVCLDCYQTRPDQVRDALERDRRMAAELGAKE